jgi:hypothetical protein
MQKDRKLQKVQLDQLTTIPQLPVTHIFFSPGTALYTVLTCETAWMASPELEQLGVTVNVTDESSCSVTES